MILFLQCMDNRYKPYENIISSETTTMDDSSGVNVTTTTEFVEQNTFRQNDDGNMVQSIKTIKRVKTRSYGPSTIIHHRFLPCFGEGKSGQKFNSSDEVMMEFIHHNNNLEHYKDFECVKAIDKKIAALKSKLSQGDNKSNISWKDRVKSVIVKEKENKGTFADKLRDKRDDEPEYKRTLFIDNLPDSFTKKDIADFIGETEGINRINLVKDRETGETRGCAFAVLENEKQVIAAVIRLNRQRIGHNLIMVQQARPK